MIYFVCLSSFDPWQDFDLNYLIGNNYLRRERLHGSLHKSLVFLVHLTTKFPIIIIFLLIVLYAIPASAVILTLYILVTILFAFPSLLILYFAYPSLDWLAREILTWDPSMFAFRVLVLGVLDKLCLVVGCKFW